MRHKWIDRGRTYGSVRADCEKCGMQRDQRFALNHHWTEYRRPGEPDWFEPHKTPPCEPKDNIVQLQETGMDEDKYLKIFEAAHREAVGQQFCYVAVPHNAVGDLYVIGYARSTEHGYFPLSEDFMVGNQTECRVKADRLNHDRLNLSPRDAARIVAGSMHQMHGE